MTHCLGTWDPIFHVPYCRGIAAATQGKPLCLTLLARCRVAVNIALKVAAAGAVVVVT